MLKSQQLGGTDVFDAVASRILAPLDWLRAALLRLVGAPGRTLIAQPALRHALLGGASVVVALLLTVWSPALLLMLGPVALGVPHLVADVRYLLVRRGLHRRHAVWLLMLLPLALVYWMRPLAVAGVCMLGAASLARCAAPRRLFVVALAAACIGLDVRFGDRATVAFAHLHNLIALVLWWTLRGARRRYELVPVAMALLGAALIATGALDDATHPALAESDGYAERMAHALSLSRDPELALRWLYLFVFGQSVHYLVWLRLVPDDARARRAPRSFVASFRALRHDFGATLLLMSVVLSLAVMAWALVDLVAARDGYLRLALFHGPMELACASLAIAEGRRP